MGIPSGRRGPRTRKGNPEESSERNWGLGEVEGLRGDKEPSGTGRPQKGKELERGDSEGKRTRAQRGKGTGKGVNGVREFLGGEGAQQPRSRGTTGHRPPA